MAFARQVRGNAMTTITRRSLVLGTMAMPIAQSALGQPATSNITRIVVPFPPGGTVDPIARMVQPGLQQRLSTIIVIENKPGASGSIGAAQVAKSPPDGSNWLFVFDTHAVNPFMQSLPFDTEKDLDPVLLIGTAPSSWQPIQDVRSRLSRTSLLRRRLSPTASLTALSAMAALVI